MNWDVLAVAGQQQVHGAPVLACIHASALKIGTAQGASLGG
jgi:hypothetical protein